MTKSFSVAMLIVGTIIGAGFASGKELVSFFGENVSPLTAVLCAALIFLISVTFLMIGAKLNAKNVSEVNQKLAGKFHLFIDAFLLVNNLIVLAGMIAGMDTLGSMIFNLRPVYSVAAAILCVSVICKGISGVIHVNKITAPVMIVVIAAVGIFTAFSAINGTEFSFRLTSPIAALVYICMNMMLASTVLTTIGKLETKTIFLASGMAAVLMGALMFVLFSALGRWGNASSDMPVLDMARAIHPAAYWLMVAVLAISIFTTMLTATAGLVSWFETFFGGKLFSAVIVLLAGFVLSNLGFSNVVKFLYPVIGVSGVIYTILAVVFVIRTWKPKAEKNRNAAISKKEPLPKENFHSRIKGVFERNKS